MTVDITGQDNGFFRRKPRRPDRRGADKGGNSFADATKLGRLFNGSRLSLSDAVTKDDEYDYYILDVRSPGILTASLTALTENADLNIYDGSQRWLGWDARIGVEPESIRLDIDPGFYYLRVDYWGQGLLPANYDLTIAFA